MTSEGPVRLTTSHHAISGRRLRCGRPGGIGVDGLGPCWPCWSFPRCLLAADEPQKDKAGAGSSLKVSYDKQIRPIFQAQCQGCHQPAKAGGGYVMTAFDRLLKGGESDDRAIVPGKPAESHLIEQITPDKDGKAEMPQNKPPLSAGEIELITRWIAQGASDDTPRNAQARYDMDHPPEYTRLPVIPALAFSPDGSLLAVAGFHEVLLWKADGSELVGRLVGLSERVESLAFSPDGKKLAVTGGRPARMGEVQVWDVAKRKLALSVPVTYDTVYGVSWSPDGTKIAFGCADNTVRAIDAKTGEQVLFSGSHNDWALDTVFSADGSHLMSVGRDMAAKLTEVATQRFVDNITSITPGALKGGLECRRPAPQARRDRDRRLGRRAQALSGVSSDGPRDRRRLQLDPRVPPLPGRIYSVAISNDGKRIAAGSSLDGKGEVSVYGYEFDTSLPPKIKAINREGRDGPLGRRKPPSSRNTTRRGSSRSPTSSFPGGDLRRRVPSRRQGPGRRGRRWDGAADQPRDRLAGQGVRPGHGQDHRRWLRTRRSPPSRPSRRKRSRPRSCPRMRAWRRSKFCPTRSA